LLNARMPGGAATSNEQIRFATNSWKAEFCWRIPKPALAGNEHDVSPRLLSIDAFVL
jgi:hypothetical protein